MSDRLETDRALVKYTDGLVEELRVNVRGALKEFDADAIHDARVATRRLSAALHLLEPVLSGGPRKKFERVLSKLRRRLAAMRDLDVMIEHLQELAAHPAGLPETEPKHPSQPGAAAPVSPSSPSSGPHAQAIAWLIAQLEEQRAEARKKAAKRSVARIMESLSAWWALHEELAQADEAAGALLADSIHLQLDAFAERAIPANRKPKSEHPGANGSHAGEKNPKSQRHDPHALRKSGKALRYTLELADNTGQPLPAGTIRAFKKMQDSLGLWHDYAVLAESAMKASMAELLAYHDPELQLRVLDLARFAVRKSSRALVRFDRLWQRRGEPLLSGIRAVFPLTKDPTAEESTETEAAGEHEIVEAGGVTKPTSDPDPSGSGQTPPMPVLPPGAHAAG
jgi:CHAD domain-containing protein